MKPETEVMMAVGGCERGVAYELILKGGRWRAKRGMRGCYHMAVGRSVIIIIIHNSMLSFFLLKFS